MAKAKYDAEMELKQEIFEMATAIADRYGYKLTGSASNSTGRGFRIHMLVSPMDRTIDHQ
ncbi:MAG TPA: hypothetical protein VF172_11780 [Nitrososphaera sp.]|jgi:hypothetical protein